MQSIFLSKESIHTGVIRAREAIIHRVIILTEITNISWIHLHTLT